MYFKAKTEKERKEWMEAFRIGTDTSPAWFAVCKLDLFTNMHLYTRH